MLSLVGNSIIITIISHLILISMASITKMMMMMILARKTKTAIVRNQMIVIVNIYILYILDQTHN